MARLYRPPCNKRRWRYFPCKCQNLWYPFGKNSSLHKYPNASRGGVVTQSPRSCFTPLKLWNTNHKVSTRSTSVLGPSLMVSVPTTFRFSVVSVAVAEAMIVMMYSTCFLTIRVAIVYLPKSTKAVLREIGQEISVWIGNLNDSELEETVPASAVLSSLSEYNQQPNNTNSSTNISSTITNISSSSNTRRRPSVSVGTKLQKKIKHNTIQNNANDTSMISEATLDIEGQILSTIVRKRCDY